MATKRAKRSYSEHSVRVARDTVRAYLIVHPGAPWMSLAVASESWQRLTPAQREANSFEDWISFLNEILNED